MLKTTLTLLILIYINCDCFSQQKESPIVKENINNVSIYDYNYINSLLTRPDISENEVDKMLNDVKKNCLQTLKSIKEIKNFSNENPNENKTLQTIKYKSKDICEKEPEEIEIKLPESHKNTQNVQKDQTMDKRITETHC